MQVRWKKSRLQVEWMDKLEGGDAGGVVESMKYRYTIQDL